MNVARPVEREKALAKRPFPVMSATTPSGRLAPTCPHHTATVGRELWIRDEVLLADLSPQAKLLIAYVAPWKIASYAEITSVLPFGDDRLAEAIREAREAEWLTLTSGRDTKKRGRKYYPRNEYHAVAAASPRSHTSPGYFTRLPITTDLGRSAGNWLLRITYLREQFRTGAIRLPDAVAAHLAGLTRGATKKTRERWTSAGILERLDLPTEEPHTATLGLTSGPYALDLARFDPDHRKTVLVAAGVEAWASQKQADFLTASPAIPHAWARTQEQPILAERIIGQMPPDEQPQRAERAHIVTTGPDEIPF